MKFAVLVALPLFLSPDHTYLREHYEKAYESRTDAKRLIKRLENKPKRSAIETAFLGATTLLMAHHDLNPFSKLNYFQKGKDFIEEAVSMEPTNAEIRYLRFVNQSETPRILGYKDNLEEDLRMILSDYAEMDEDLKSRIGAFMETCSYLTKEQRQFFNQ